MRIKRKKKKFDLNKGKYDGQEFIILEMDG